MSFGSSDFVSAAMEELGGRRNVKSLCLALGLCACCQPYRQHGDCRYSGKADIDILVEINPDTDWQRIKDKMAEAGYIRMSFSDTRMGF